MTITTSTASRNYANYREIEKALAAGVDSFSFKQRFTAGAIRRPFMRSFLRLHSIRFSEDGSFVSSYFVVLIDTKAKAVAIAALSRKLDAENCLEIADELLEKQPRLIWKNRFRKITFRSALPVPYATMDRNDIAQLFMLK